MHRTHRSCERYITYFFCCATLRNKWNIPRYISQGKWTLCGNDIYYKCMSSQCMPPICRGNDLSEKEMG